jgi:hypothetical protein
VDYHLTNDASLKLKKREKLKTLIEIKKAIEKMNILKQEVHKASQDKTVSGSVFITFQRTKDRDFFKHLLKFKFSHLLSKFLRQKKATMSAIDRLIYTEEPPLPQSVKWKNYSYSAKQKFFRRILSWTVYILLYSLRKLELT